MKKFLALALSVLLILSLSACGAKETPVEDKTPATTTDTTPDAGQYKDGVYKAEEEKGEYGYEAVEVTVEGGKISKADLKRMNPDGTEVNYEEWVGVAGTDGSIKPNLKQFREDIAASIVEKQSTEGIDTISGATDSTKSWLELVNKALETAK
ncbi:MAG: hypothetical protein K0R09_355 [Clostridiales bacterium]|jgi:uncharacterized protein with FMN-binding domain|nr:hypothetical protein [Clostridiales bacterium]